MERLQKVQRTKSYNPETETLQKREPQEEEKKIIPFSENFQQIHPI